MIETSEPTNEGNNAEKENHFPPPPEKLNFPSSMSGKNMEG